MNEEIIEAAKVYIHDLFKSNSDGHDENHSLIEFRNELECVLR